MTVLAIVLGPTDVTVSAAGAPVTTHALPPQRRGPGPSGPTAEEVWRAVLGALGQAGTDGVSGLTVTGPSTSLVLWDAETLGSPRPALLPPDPRAADPGTALAWVAEHERHTWALVLDERYAVGPVASYVVARMTRGVHHVTTDPAWSADRARELGVPAEVLPDLVRPGTAVGATDPRLVRGLRLPISV